jgi:hypothetical protein
MKLRFLVLALLVTTAGVASAHMLVPMPGPPGVSPGSKMAPKPTLPLDQPPSAGPVRRTALAMTGSPRPPVPLLLRTRRHVFVPAPEVAGDGSPVAGDGSPVAGDSAPLDKIVAPAGNKMSENAAKAVIEADGYKDVHALSRASDGTWTARALRGETEVSLSVDLAGNVSLN